MAYKLLTEIGWEDGYYRRYYCQSSADLTSLPTSPTIAIGSEAVLENGAVYRLSNANTWTIFKPASSVSAISAIDQVTANANEVVVKSSIISGTQVGTDVTQTFAASSAVNTTKITSWTKPSVVKEKYEWIVSNPSLITDIVWSLYNSELTFNGETRDALLSDFPVTIPKSTSVVIEDCEDAWAESDPQGANATMDVDAVNKIVGTNSASFVLGADCPVGIIATEAIPSTNLSLYTHIYGWIKSNVALAAGDFQLLLDDTANCASPLETLNIPAVLADTWTRFRIPLANPATDLAIISIGLKQIVDKGAVTVLLDDIRAVTMSTMAYMVTGAFNGVNVTEKKSNSTVLGANDAFSTISRVREI